MSSHIKKAQKKLETRERQMRKAYCNYDAIYECVSCKKRYKHYDLSAGCTRCEKCGGTLIIKYIMRKQDPNV